MGFFQVVLLLGCCFYGVFCDVPQDQCPCQDPSYCQLIKTPPRKELFVFRVGDPDDWKQYDWSHITTVAEFGPYDPEIMCYAHSKGARYVSSAYYPANKLNNATARSAWVKMQLNTALSRFVDGINIDFESNLNESEAPDLVALVNETARAFKMANPYAQISFDTPYASGCTWDRCYDFKNLSEYCDFFVIMDYDLFDLDMAISNDPFQRVKIGVESFQADGIPASKLVTAFPWYGYDYECTHVLKDDICSQIGTPRYDAQSAKRKIPYSEITQMLKDLKAVGTLNSTFVSKFFDYTDETTGKHHQVWYDDPETLAVRYLYAKNADLRGVAMWNAECLDYGPDPETQKLTKAMWDAIDEFFGTEQVEFNTDTECTAAVKAVAIPPAKSYPDPDKYFYENCRQWNLPKYLEFWPDINYTHYNATKVACENGWMYNHSRFQTTITEDWQLVCEDEGVTNIMTSVFFVGFMVGSFVFGIMSDWFGRKKALFAGMVMWFLGALATPFTSAPWNYYIVRFVTGAGQLGRYIPAFVLVNEFVGAEWRVVAGVFSGISYSLGYMTVALVAMAIRRWRVLAFVPIIPLFLSLFVMLPLTESVRWLLAKGRVREAEDVIKKVARWNKKQLPDVIFDEKEVHEFKESSKGQMPSFYHLYLTPNMCFRTLVLHYNWMTNSMVYYGLAFSTQSLGFDMYWTFFLFGAVEIPALLYATVGIRVFGRKINMILLELIGGVACLATIFIEDAIGRTVVAMVGKFCITATLNVLYLWTCELSPTPVRSVALGVCSVAARVGGIVAPLIFNLAKQDNITNDLHLIVFGAATVIAGLLLIPLPETKGRDLPETMREGEEFGKFHFMKSWRWGRGRYKDTESLNGELNMDVYNREVLNPAFVPDVDEYAYTARPPPSYEALKEKACQFPEKPRQKRKEKARVVGKNGPKPGVEVVVDAAAVHQGSLPETLGEGESSSPVEVKRIAEEVVSGDEAPKDGCDTLSGGGGDKLSEGRDDKLSEGGGDIGDGNDRSGLLAWQDWR